MRILYFANFNNEENHLEEDIKYGLEQLGHEVIAIHEKNYEELQSLKGDMLLFHKAGVGTYIDLNQWIKILNHVTCKKVMWYLDKIVGDRERYVEGIADYIDYGFLVDDTWRRRHKYTNFYPLKEGVGHSLTTGHIVDHYKCDVAFAGGVYRGREQFAELLMAKYRDNFRIFDDVYGQELSDLHASVKVIVAPLFPSDEFYWSSRFYLTLGTGGFMVHPDLYGLKEEFIEGKHFAGYKGFEEMIATIDYFLEHEEERKAICQQGYHRCQEVAKIEDRLKTLLEIVYGTKES